jgi:hypothetical protein
MLTVNQRIAAGELKRASFFLPPALIRKINAAAAAADMTVSDWATAVFTAALKRITKTGPGNDRS